MLGSSGLRKLINLIIKGNWQIKKENEELKYMINTLTTKVDNLEFTINLLINTLSSINEVVEPDRDIDMIHSWEYNQSDIGGS